MQKFHRSCPFFVIALILHVCIASKAQDSTSGSVISINNIGVTKSISNQVSTSFTDLDFNIEKSFAELEFIPGIKFKGTIPNKYVTKKLVMKFNLSNTTEDTDSIYFFPGFYYKYIQLYRIEGSSLNKIPNVLPKNSDSIGYRLITIKPYDSVIIVAELHFLKTYVNTIRPRLVNIKNVDSFMAQVRSQHTQANLFTYLFCGLLLMMILFSLSNFFQSANREFLYYSGYALFIGLMLLTKAIYSFRIESTSFFLEAYMDFILMNTGIIFYMTFMKIFLTTKSKHPFLYKLYTSGTIFLIISMLGYTFFHYLTNNYVAENLIENVTKFLLLIWVVLFLIYSVNHWTEKLFRYLFWGNLFLLLFSIISFAAVVMSSAFSNFFGILRSSIFYYEVGLFLELVLFLSALNYKNNKRIIEETKERENLKAQNQLKEYEKEIAIYKAQLEERQRISADMHDELGSGMTAIRLMSEIARNKMKENTPVEIDKISSSADDVLNKMNAIIWSMNSGNDTLDNLISYIRVYANEYFENTPVECIIETPNIIEPIEILGDKRRNIFLSLKESLNNILKHAKASRVIITIKINTHLHIQILDNGIGIDKENLRKFGNGLKNISRRMESIGGTFTIENSNGTKTNLELPL